MLPEFFFFDLVVIFFSDCIERFEASISQLSWPLIPHDSIKAFSQNNKESEIFEPRGILRTKGLKGLTAFPVLVEVLICPLQHLVFVSNRLGKIATDLRKWRNRIEVFPEPVTPVNTFFPSPNSMTVSLWLQIDCISSLFSKHEEKKPGQIISTDIKGNFFQNIRGQKLFIVEGKVINQFDTPRSFIKLKGMLFDANGAEIVSREAFAGWSFSEDELRNLSSKEVDDKLNNKMGESLSNFDIPPSAIRPFMIVFYDVMGAVSSVSVVVLESQTGSQ
jgi:hypothetical protein